MCCSGSELCLGLLDGAVFVPDGIILKVLRGQELFPLILAFLRPSEDGQLHNIPVRIKQLKFGTLQDDIVYHLLSRDAFREDHPIKDGVIRIIQTQYRQFRLHRQHLPLY